MVRQYMVDGKCASCDPTYCPHDLINLSRFGRRITPTLRPPACLDQGASFPQRSSFYETMLFLHHTEAFWGRNFISNSGTGCFIHNTLGTRRLVLTHYSSFIIAIFISIACLLRRTVGGIMCYKDAYAPITTASPAEDDFASLRRCSPAIHSIFHYHSNFVVIVPKNYPPSLRVSRTPRFKTWAHNIVK
jgi:hypothetical protein